MTMEVAQNIQQTVFEQYLKSIKEQSSNKQEICNLITAILENGSINTYSEFLQLPEISELKTSEFEKYYNTLNLFAFGTYRQFLESKEKIISLTPVMDKKLKHLTILTLATQRKTLKYDDLMNELDIKNVRHLEDIIIEAVYAELINGKLDQKNRQLEIDYAVARDIQTENIQDIVSILSDWLKSCESCLNCLQEQIETANAEKAKRLKHKERLEEQLTEVKKNIKKREGGVDGQMYEEQDEDKSFMGASEKKDRRTKKAGSSKNWFKTFQS